ncbi:AAA family ATPase [uncultured Draconibacterium sp.]|uniref:AAA family ATPase n=1 Tax=uncultured Draconibacterium sp. TaxID=1573823 RepID=UPI0029C8BE4B|nr:AAA family ATPase [uncultured Draconibacterium sp.]
MGNLVIKQVKYSGEKYSFESPEFGTGINIIVGDNGSGKSTFSYFIEFGLGGSIEAFKKEKEEEKKLNNSKYEQIREDENNFVQLDILINSKPYSLKRFIGTNDIFFEENGVIGKLPINRNADYAPRTFSDWLLEKLEINVFELSLGTSSWLIGFKDLFRLLNYDQDTDSRKIFKAASADNYIADSSIIRKSIFETLIGINSEEYNIKYNEFKKAQKEKNDAKIIYDDFLENNHVVDNELEAEEKKLEEFEEQLGKLIQSRESYQKQNTNSDEKTEQLSQIQNELIEIDLQTSEYKVKKQTYTIEVSKIEKLLAKKYDEISQIEKIIFTHDKLNLFSLEICPFCMGKVEPQNGKCICGHEIKDDDYEKFVYKSSEYKEILDHKKKSIKTIKTAFDSYRSELLEIEKTISSNILKSNKLKEELRLSINAIEFSGNSQIIDRLNDKILEVKEDILKQEKVIELLNRRNQLQKRFNDKNETFKEKDKAFKKISEVFNKNNTDTINEFNEIYSILLSKSSCKSNHAEINDDYMPYIDYGIYKEKSAVVPIRLMYYFTFLSLGMKRESVKHPRFLLIDTPQGEGIDESNLKLNIKLLDEALELSKNNDEDEIKDYQVILTTGEGKYPDEYERFIKRRFNKVKGDFILKKIKVE